MENLFVSFKIAMALKVLGFDEPCLTYYYNDGTTSDILACDRKMEYFINSKQGEWSPFGASAPHYLQVQDWLNKKYALKFCCIFVGMYGMYFIGDTMSTKPVHSSNYYEALDKSIEEALALIK